MKVVVTLIVITGRGSVVRFGEAGALGIVLGRGEWWEGLSVTKELQRNTNNNRPTGPH